MMNKGAPFQEKVCLNSRTEQGARLTALVIAAGTRKSNLKIASENTPEPPYGGAEAAAVTA
jgi:hypothetical protein